jgi:DNA-binding response OmpR family regulator
MSTNIRSFFLPVLLEPLLPRVLIVDDEPGIRFALKRWFERQHWTVSEAGDGQTAMTQLLASDDASESRVDLVICDLHLPLLSGEELLRTLLESRPAVAARLILSTGDAVSDAAPGTALAIHPHVLQKPFELATLKTLVASIVS